MKNLFFALLLITIAQSLAYIQLQGQFLWTWAKDHPIVMACMGVPISIFLIYFTKYCAIAFDGQVWPGRLIGFSIGAIVFAVLSYYVMGEAFTTKTTICLMLAVLILAIQILF